MTGKISASTENPDCPECGNPETRVYHQLIKIFSYECPECGEHFKTS